MTESKHTLMTAGVCMRVPFNRVSIVKMKKAPEPNEMVDFAGVRSYRGGRGRRKKKREIFRGVHCIFEQIKCSLLHVQVRLHEYDEGRKILVGALQIRRKYMELSHQTFYKTTAMMLDNKPPPSSSFCVSGDSDKMMAYNVAGDMVECKLIIFFVVSPF